MSTTIERGSVSRDDPSAWYKDALAVLNTPCHEQYEFVADVVLSQIQYKLVTGDATITVQDGLYYEVDPVEMASDWAQSLVDWSLYVPPSATLSSVCIECLAKSTDVATITNTPGPGEFAQEPKQETTTFVDRTMRATVTLGQEGFSARVSVSIVQHRMGDGDETE